MLMVAPTPTASGQCAHSVDRVSMSWNNAAAHGKPCPWAAMGPSSASRSLLWVQCLVPGPSLKHIQMYTVPHNFTQNDRGKERGGLGHTSAPNAIWHPKVVLVGIIRGLGLDSRLGLSLAAKNEQR
uniref:Uncharacterized protein n=1 Tax=Eutreptiella gymnastica TaxID=73025 RepID=A0A7S1HW47_9EUGL|mmetsp:Transcript_110071/g.190692  ORF Transcript_110071/g.190692 Transcript_110071/m.190692 type:complete len:126 (+) Transcript_110071:164-541(+)